MNVSEKFTTTNNTKSQHMFLNEKSRTAFQQTGQNNFAETDLRI